LDTMHEVRTTRKRILKTKGRKYKVKLPMKIYTPDRFKAVRKMTIERAGLTASWHDTPDGRVWGVRARALPDGEYDAVDEISDGVQEEEVIDSGEEEVRRGQQDVKFQALSSQIGALTSSAASFVAAAMGHIDGSKCAGVDGSSSESASGSGESSDEDSSSEESGAAMFRFVGQGPGPGTAASAGGGNKLGRGSGPAATKKSSKAPATAQTASPEEKQGGTPGPRACGSNGYRHGVGKCLLP